ncbi:MAG: PilZ domain-containing protein [Calditrichaeota bacterium]|nr:PilZ domain-containing protein [Calditrichota bacterium]
MRKTIRHPTRIPIEYKITGENIDIRENSRNISIGGISFRVDSFLVPDTILLIRIPSVDPSFEAIGRVIWCLQKENGIEVGVEFIDEHHSFRVRLIEQICYIRDYQQDVLEKEGRKLSDEEAALEWTRKFAGKFPAI